MMSCFKFLFAFHRETSKKAYHNVFIFIFQILEGRKA